MASTYSSNLRLELIGGGEQQGVWNVTTNTNLGTLLEEAIGGYVQVTMGDANYTLTTNFGAADEARNASIKVVSSVSLTATRNLVVPTIEKTYLIWNATSGGRSIQVKTSGGAGVTIANGTKALIVVDGADCITFFETPLPIASGGTGSTTAAAAVTALGAAGIAVSNTFTAAQTISLSSGSNRFRISSSAGSGKYVVHQTAGVTRWETGSNSDTESGSNAGSNFVISRYDDSGVFVSNPLTINRSTGVTNISSLTLSSALPVSSGGTGATSASAARTALGAVGLADTNVFTAIQEIRLSSGSNRFYIGSVAGSSKYVSFQTSTVSRWEIGSNSSAESGSNVGSDFQISRYSDAGAFISAPLTIDRATGITEIEELTLGAALSVSNGGTGATSASAARTALDVPGLATFNVFTETQEIERTGAGANLFLTSNGGSGRSWLITSATGGSFTIYDNTAARSVIDVRANGDMVNICPGALIGYATGAGGSVTQLTSKATAVTLNTGCGDIITASDALAAGATVSFTVNNSLLSSSDAIVVHRRTGGTAGSYRVWVDSSTSGSFVITLQNISGGSLSEAITIRFMVFNGATS